MRGTGRVKRFIRRRLPSMLPGVPVLLYHRVTDVAVDPWGLCVTPGHFAEHLQVLRRQCRPLRLRRLFDDGDRPPPSAIAISFDDGYADTLLNAHPLLERYGIPATVFMPTGRLDLDAEFWWDELERMLLQPGLLPRLLHLAVAGRAYHWDLSEIDRYTADQVQRYGAWKAWETAPTMRHTLYRQLYDLLHALEPAGRAAAVADLRAWAGCEQGSRSTHRSLSVEEMRSLDRSHLIEIGAHTVTHPNLAVLTPQAQAAEIQQSKACLEKILGHPVGGFAYPFGGRCDYTAQTIAQVRACEFTYACSNFGGLATRATDRFQLPRMQVHNWDGAEFAAHLNRWFGW